jgi:hypothetical protein
MSDRGSRNLHSQGHSSDPELAAKTGAQDGEKGQTTEADLEVFWEEPADQDPANPMNWESLANGLLSA